MAKMPGKMTALPKFAFLLRANETIVEAARKVNGRVEIALLTTSQLGKSVFAARQIALMPRCLLKKCPIVS
jgi:hypothetical protein